MGHFDRSEGKERIHARALSNLGELKDAQNSLTGEAVGKDQYGLVIRDILRECPNRDAVIREMVRLEKTDHNPMRKNLLPALILEQNHKAYDPVEAKFNSEEMGKNAYLQLTANLPLNADVSSPQVRKLAWQTAHHLNEEIYLPENKKAAVQEFNLENSLNSAPHPSDVRSWFDKTTNRIQIVIKRSPQ